MEPSPGLGVLGTTSLLEEATSLPGVDPKCGSQASHSLSLSSSDPLALMQDTPVCTEVTEALTNGVNHSRPAIKGTNSKDTTTTTQHTIKANTRNNTHLLPLTKALYKIPMLTSSRFSFLTSSPATTTVGTDQTLTYFQIADLFLPARTTNQLFFPNVEWCLDSSYMVFLFVVCQNVHSIWTV